MKTKKEKEPRRKIEVETVPNGYAVDIEGHGYLYFTEQELMEGMIMHILENKSGDMNKEESRGFVNIVRQWSDISDAMKEVQRLTRELAAMTKNRNGLARKVISERNRTRDILQDIEISIQNESFSTLRRKLQQMKGLRVIELKELGVNSNAIATDDDLEEM